MSSHLVFRPKHFGFGNHYGVLLEDMTVVELQPEGHRRISYDEFKGEKEVFVEKTVTDDLEVVERIYKNVNQGEEYDLLLNNCEHFSRGIVEGKFISNQIKALGIILIVFVAFIFLNNNEENVVNRIG